MDMGRKLSSCLPSAVIFDMDGLIFDTEALYQEALLALASERGLGSITPTLVNQTVGLSWSDTRQLLAQALPNQVDVDELISAWTDRYGAMAENNLVLKPGVINLIDVLEQQGIARAVATGSYRDVAMHHLISYGLDVRFDVIVGKEDCTKGKPAPDPFLLSAQRLGVDPADCWALEDSLNGIRSAFEAGMQPIMIPDLVSPDEETTGLCSHIASSLHEVVGLIRDRQSAGRVRVN